MQRFLAIVLGLVVIGAGAGYFVVQRQHGQSLELAQSEATRLLEEQRGQADVVARELALDVVRVLALAVAEDVARGDVKTLEERLAAAVQGNRLEGVLVLAADGSVLSSTDLRYRGRTLDDPATLAAARVDELTVAEEAPVEGQVEIDAPLFSGGNKVGFLRAFVQLGDASGAVP